VDRVEGVAGWEEPGRGLAPGGIVSARVAVLRFPIEEALHATDWIVPSVVRRW